MPEDKIAPVHFLKARYYKFFTIHVGALAITVANPTDLVKVRLQAEGKLPPGVPRRYSGALNAYSTIVRQVITQKTNT